MTRPERTTAQRALLAWPLSFLALAAAAAALFAVRPSVDKAHVALVFLLVVLGGSAAGGRLLGITLSITAFAVFDFVFLPPYYTFAIRDPLDWLVLAAFLITGIVAAQLLARADERAEIARRRADEVQRIAMLGAEALSVGRAEAALAAVARVIQSTLAVACCEVLIQRAKDGAYERAAAAGACVGAAAVDAASLAAWVARAGAAATERADRTTHLEPRADGAEPALASAQAPAWLVDDDVRALLVPLRVRDRIVGVLRVSHEAPIRLDPAQRQFLEALAYYAALGVERVRLSAEAERAESFRQAGQLKDALIAGVSHDLRTPLTTIKALAHGLAVRGEADARSIEEEADRLNRMVADLLDLSRLNAGAMPLDIGFNVADEIVGVALQRIRGLRGDRSIEIDAPRGVPLAARCDQVQAVRVLVNLLENALKYSPPETPITLSVRQRGNRIEFTVADRGPGIPSEERERVFTPFYRPLNARPDVGGAGLGLAIARGMADVQNGRVWMEPRDGGGSVFRFDLPLAELPKLDAPA
ncbi:MAG TPA: ATP-binding protein [Gemmatimonadaceae bacterium]|nr:ATP-binding protein [Gemmatimonadaceae bacterium]